MPEEDQQQFLDLTITGLSTHITSIPSLLKGRQPSQRSQITLSILDISLHNLLSNIDVYDFPVILYSDKPVTLKKLNSLSEKVRIFNSWGIFADEILTKIILQLSFINDNSLLSMEIVLESSPMHQPCVTSISLSNQTICIELEYKLLQVLLTKVDSFVTLISIVPVRTHHNHQVCLSILLHSMFLVLWHVFTYDLNW